MDKKIEYKLNKINKQINNCKLNTKETNDELLGLLDFYQNEKISQDAIEYYVNTYISFLNYNSENILEAQKIVCNLSHKLSDLYYKEIKLNENLIKKLITKTLYTADTLKFSAEDLISSLLNISLYNKEIVKYIHTEALIVNSEYLQFVDPAIAIEYLVDSKDILSLLHINKFLYTNDKMEVLADYILNNDVNIEVYADVLNNLIQDFKQHDSSDSFKKNDPAFDSLAISLFDEIDIKHPLLNKIKYPKKTLLLYIGLRDDFNVPTSPQNYMNFLEIFIVQNMLSNDDLKELIHSFEIKQIKQFLYLNEKYNISIDNIDTALNILSKAQHCIYDTDVEVVVNSLIYCGKKPSDYFNMEKFDKNICSEITLKYEEFNIYNNLKYF